MPSAATIRSFAADPAAFLADLVMPAARGPARFSSVMAPHQRERFASLVPALIAVARGQQPATGKHWWEATKGASKDTDLAAALLWLLAFSARALSCQIGAADADQADELRKAAKSILRLNPWLAGRVEIQSLRILCKATHGEAEIIAADTAGSHGARPDVLILNELSHVTKQEFAENLADNASKVPHGLVVIATNAGFSGTWQWKWREIARTSPRWSFHQFAKPAPWLDAEEIAEAAKRNGTERFRRLWHGVWSSGAGDAIDEADIAASIDDTLSPMTDAWQPAIRDPNLPHIGPAIQQPKDSPRYGFVAGLDLGVKNDRSAIVVLASDVQTQRIRLAYSHSWQPDRHTGRVDLEAVESTILALHRRFGMPVHYDPWQGALMAQRLTRQGVAMVEMPFIGGNLNKMATTLLDTFRSRRISIYPQATQLLADLRRLTIVEKSYGYKLESTRDADGHADLATALAIALPAACNNAGSYGGLPLVFEGNFLDDGYGSRARLVHSPYRERSY